jgi:hypothetical protein
MEDNSEINGLEESVRLQANSIDNLLRGLTLMSDQISQRPTKKKVWRIVTGAVGLVLVVVLAFSALAYDSSHNVLDKINGCLDPQEECAQQSEAASQQIRGQIVCNQEKIMYFIYPQDYVPLPFCVDIINTEIDRNIEAGVDASGTPKLEVPEGIVQVVPLKDTFGQAFPTE